jgi:acyl-CoA dehydrogenase
MSDTESVIVATAERVFAKFADPQTIINARDNSWAKAAWAGLEETGLPLAWVPDALGGAGAPLDEGFAALRAAGRAALAVPLAETLLAGWLLSSAGIPSPSGAMTVAPARPKDVLAVNSDGRLSGAARGVPFAREADHLAALATASGRLVVALVRSGDCRVTPRPNLAGDSSDLVDFSGVTPLALAPSELEPDGLLRMGAVVRAQQIAGALETLLDISVRYASERVAFGKPIAKFQAIQHNLARLGGEVAAATAAAVSAADAVSQEGLTGYAALLEIAAAKTRAGEAAETGAGMAHQTHGAIGFTAEHVLHRFSLRALSWRDDFGDEAFWSGRLGAVIADRGADALWPLLASR